MMRSFSLAGSDAGSGGGSANDSGMGNITSSANSAATGNSGTGSNGSSGNSGGSSNSGIGRRHRDWKQRLSLRDNRRKDTERVSCLFGFSLLNGRADKSSEWRWRNTLFAFIFYLVV